MQYLKDNERPHEYVLNARLFPDMKPLAYQINVMTNVCYSGTPRKDWLWVDNFAKPTDPKTFEGCADRIRKTLEFLEALKPEDVIDMPIAFWPTGEFLFFCRSCPFFECYLTLAYTYASCQRQD